MKNINYLIRSGIALVVVGAIIGLVQLWTEVFAIETFSKIITTLLIIGGALFLGGILYHEYLDNRKNKDKNLLG